ncbi:MAG: UDP-N-acetylmuramate dehydrogenase [Acidimicrobiia bacterium]|nr:UDP-N-acetylmuramate dehydrogenase [Acidimicrobiia bacterium]NNF63686.1 UDP-N-acetylmuramate dehydrogenase [Acidimicrobiia bacterium]
MSAFAALVEAGVVQENVPLAPFTTYKMGGPARWFVEARERRRLREVIAAWTKRHDAGAALVLGRGSNMLVADSGFDGLVIKLSGEFADIVIDDDVVEAGGGAPLAKVARTAAAAGRGGLEFFVGVPGSVGGAVKMNAGCHGSETADWLIDVDLLDLASGRERVVPASDLDLAYRHSALADSDLVVAARFRTQPRAVTESEQLMREVTQWRKKYQPGGTFNAGSVFKNPVGDSAGRLIDDVGLKGLSVGGASVSTKHANFIISESGATSRDVFELIEEVRARVTEATGVELVPEVRLVGDFNPAESDG